MANPIKAEIAAKIAEQKARMEKGELFTFGAHEKEVSRADVAKLSGARTFKPKLSDVQGLIGLIAKGFAWMPCLLDEGARRANVNANKTELLALDIDNGLTIEEALKNPFITQYAILVIESAGSKVYDAERNPDCHEKFRIVFRVDGVILGWESIRICLCYLMHLIPESDDACKDPARFFFGAKGKEAILVNESARLPQDFYDKAMAWWEEEPQAKAEQARHQASYQEHIKQNPAAAECDEQLVEKALSVIPRRVAGSKTYGMHRNILWGLCKVVGVDRAIAMMESHSPSAECGWNVAQVARSGGSYVNAETFWWYTWQYGFEFPDKKKGKSQKKQVKPPVQLDPEVPQEWGYHSAPSYGLVYSYKQERKWVYDTLGNHLKAIAYTKNTEESGASLLFEFKTVEGHICQILLPRAGLASNFPLLMDELLSRGWKYDPEETKRIRAYLMQQGSGLPVLIITDSTGWVRDSFVMPHRTIGDTSLRYRDVIPPTDSPIVVKGTTESWSNTVGKLAQGNSRLMFSIGVAFAAPLTKPLDIESGGFHIYGATSSGKTTTLNVAAGVVGLAKVPSWHATGNGLESIAAAHNHLILPLDEIGQANPHDVGNAIYGLGNGSGKGRMTKDLVARKTKTWQNLFLSTGEVSISDYIAQTGKTRRGGQEVRLLDIPFGGFEDTHEFSTSTAFVSQLEKDYHNHCGAVFQDFLVRLVADQSPDWLSKHRLRLEQIRRALVAGIEDTAIGRAATRFALVQLGLEIAKDYGLVPFPTFQIEWAVGAMFRSWVDGRGGSGSIEVKQALKRIEQLFVSNEHGDRIYRLDGSGAQLVRNLLAYRKADERDTNSVEFWVPPIVFEAEFVKDVDRALLVKELQKRGWLKLPEKDGKTAIRRRLNGNQQRFYVFDRFWVNDSPFTPQDTQDTGDFEGVREGVSVETQSGKDFQNTQDTKTPKTPKKPKSEKEEEEKNSEGWIEDWDSDE